MLPRYWLVMPAAGRGRRVGAALPKQYLSLGGSTVLEQALAPFEGDPRCLGLAIAFAPDDPRGPAIVAQLRFARLRIAVGGSERCQSVAAALAALADLAADGDWVLVHDAARPGLARSQIDALFGAVGDACGALLALPVIDTLKQAAEPDAVTGSPRVVKTVERAGLWRAQTPQMFRYGPLCAALAAAEAAGRVPTDEAQAMEWQGHTPVLVPGSEANGKITGPEDLERAAALRLMQQGGLAAAPPRVGFGTDIHAFGPGDHVMLGGVRIPCECGVVAHSDGDVVLHALCDALLGAVGLGDIGELFPDSDPRWRGAPSRLFVAEVLKLVAGQGRRPVQADITVIAQRPRIAAHRAAIRASIAALLGIEEQSVNVKATSSERLGFIGRAEGLMAQAIVTLI
ncbi:MAG: 2-C-methyl-D-erythritol 2,4-cyclodiphosphate synthase [Steroidobacteraceae bacterium]|nr:2-C-methyl-D-erythritol 2,4-cyclodiphosphate synthase [Steroidobacteraceae bacterium]MDW8258593.1 2-C-methyl-D-erythritol 2,4-cyclodiphosphate synthase [Gammaproteobacteria bacterium]